MSVRAYRVNSIEREDDSTFNLWRDTALLEFFEGEEMYDGRGQEGGGTIEVSVEALKKAVKKAKSLKLEKWVVDALKDDIKWAEAKHHEYVMYDCY